MEEMLSHLRVVVVRIEKLVAEAGNISGTQRKGNDRLCGLVVKVPGYRFRGPGSIPGATRFFLRSSESGTGSTQPRDDN
jgi:hypothetical protein